MDIVIKIDNLSKQYHIRHESRGYVQYSTLREDIASKFKSLLSMRPAKLNINRKTSIEEFWALKKIQLEIAKGERVGIIGRNGSGKSTLLKILSQVTAPTTGSAVIQGKVSSLLEVGTGFHPELTGRENIFLNGAILGMSRKEIREKFNEIIIFSGIEKFIDTPVKRYSSGMYVRLAFSVAAHLEPEILIVDEVLAVGDAAFQKKCIGKMRDVSSKGRTLLFVSHNMAAIEQLCTKCVVMESGQTKFIGDTTAAIKYYLDSLNSGRNKKLATQQRKGSGEVHIKNITFKDSKGNRVNHIQCGNSISIHLEYEKQVDVDLSNLVVGISFKNEIGSPVFLQHNRLSGHSFNQIPDKGSFVCNLDSVPLVPSRYYLNTSIFKNGSLGTECVDALENVATIDIEASNFFGTGELPGPGHGPVLIKATWSIGQ